MKTKQKSVKWGLTRGEMMLVGRIVRRAYRELETIEDAYGEPADLSMDIEACHNNGCKLDLGKLLHAPAFDFAHDIYGIHKHLNRETGEMQHCFLPRCAE